LYPNPVSDGDEVYALLIPGAGGPVIFQLFTTAYRKILETSLPSVPVGRQPVKIILRDSKGKALSNGLYYVRVITPGERAIAKLLVLR
jgi:hypothetical protein